MHILYVYMNFSWYSDIWISLHPKENAALNFQDVALDYPVIIGEIVHAQMP